MNYEAVRAYPKPVVNDRHYNFRCQACDVTLHDDGFLLECPMDHGPALLVAEYSDQSFVPDLGLEGIARYRRWLPATRVLPGAPSSVTYQSRDLNRVIGLPKVWVVFNGYWPERGATLETTTFKELEAWTVLSRIPEQHDGVLVVASAGNTAAAFARACSLNKVPCLIVIPEGGLPALQLPASIHPCVRIVSLTGSSDYSDAIAVADRVSRMEGFFPEGGVKNVARRDALGTTVLNAVETIGQIPQYYFQAVGSGTGAIAAHEAATRLVGDGAFGNKAPRLMLSQNLPFVPMYLSWKSSRRELMHIPDAAAKNQIQQLAAPVLSNRRPAYSITGGVFDVLTDAGGDMFTADNLEALHAKQLFEETEGIDIDPASAVAFATLLKAARYDGIERDALVLLNITGGGRDRQLLDKKLIAARPALELTVTEILTDEAAEEIAGLFR